jgi:hypothetical protein
MGYENPLMKLPAMRQVMALPAEQRGPLEALMRELRADADRQAEESWRKRKGPMAAYWRAVSTYARHVAHALSKASPGDGVAIPAPAQQPTPLPDGTFLWDGRTPFIPSAFPVGVAMGDKEADRG